MDLDGDRLDEGGHPWGGPPPRTAPAPTTLQASPYRRRRLTALAVLTLVAVLAGILTSVRASADLQRPAVAATARTGSPAPATTPSYRRTSVAENPVLATIPTPVLHDYRRFGARFHLDWRLLAAIGYNESDHGKSELPGVHSPAPGGCCGGIMMICDQASCGDAASTYGVDGNGNGVISIFEDPDAVATAANILNSLRKEVGRDPRLLLAAYNAGAGAVLEAHGVPDYPETEAYVRNGLATIHSLPSGPMVPVPAAHGPRSADTGGLGAG